MLRAMAAALSITAFMSSKLIIPAIFPLSRAQPRMGRIFPGNDATVVSLPHPTKDAQVCAHRTRLTSDFGSEKQLNQDAHMLALIRIGPTVLILTNPYRPSAIPHWVVVFEACGWVSDFRQPGSI